MENSPLGRLSAELRNKISEFALMKDGPICLNTTAVRNQPLASATFPLHRPCALSQTCRQMRRETGEMFFASNTFVIFVGHAEHARLSAWLRALGSQIVSRLKHIAFRMRHCFGDSTLMLYGLESGRAKAADTMGGDIDDEELELEGLARGSSFCRLIMTTLQDMGLKLRGHGIYRSLFTQDIYVVEEVNRPSVKRMGRLAYIFFGQHSCTATDWAATEDRHLAMPENDPSRIK